MATAEVGIFDAPPEDELPEFARVLLGYDPREVDEHLRESSRQLMTLEVELHRARAEAQTALQRVSAAREEVYAEIAGRMADVIKATDQHAERVRGDAEEAARGRVMEAEREAGEIQTEAKAEADQLRSEAGEVLDRAKAEAADVMGRLEGERESALREMERLGERLSTLAGRLQDIRKGVRPSPNGRHKVSSNGGPAGSSESDAEAPEAGDSPGDEADS